MLRLVDLQQKTRQGVLAEYARVPAGFVALRPDNVTPVQAAGFTLTAMTSYQALYKIAKLEPEQTILVNGGSTSAGTFAIQLAKAVGAKVVATASGRNEEFVRKQGADEVCCSFMSDFYKFYKDRISSSTTQNNRLSSTCRRTLLQLNTTLFTMQLD